MEELFKEKGFILSCEQVDKFSAYRDLIKEYNKIANITSLTEDDDINEKHFLDSAMALPFFKDGSKVIEIGSGGGFPSIPLKILNPSLDFTLVEATGKKCNLLNIFIEKLNLTGIKVINARAEDLAKNKEYRENFDYCTARAVARLNTLNEYCLPFVKVGGEFIALKGESDDELKEAENSISILGGKINFIKKFILSEKSGNRSIISIKKVSSTPEKYPRGNGKERNNPL